MADFADNQRVEMTSGQKIAFSLLAALGLFAAFVLSLHSTLFKELETRFYTQSKIEENTGQLDKISESCDSYISEILTLVEKGENAWTKNASVRSYYVQNPSESDVNTRRRLTETLFSEIPALNGIRIVDKNGRNVHYSSFDDSDLLKQNGISKIYKNYNDIVKDTGEIDFETLQKITSETKSVLLCDESRARLILAVPFCWVDGIYSGICLFYLNLHQVENELIARDVISLGQSLTLFSDDDYNGGFIFNLPYGNRQTFRQPVLSYWKNRSEAMARGSENYQQPEKLLELPDGRFYLGLSSNRIGKIRVSAVYTSDIFELSAELRLLIYICIFISILLIVFLIFSLFRDPVVTLQKRIKKLQLGIIENYLDGKEKREWNDLARQLRNRRNDLSDEIIKSLHVHSKKRRKELSDYLEKNWDEIFAIFEAKAANGVNGVSAANGANTANGANAPVTNAPGSADISGASIAEIRRMLEEVLQNRGVTTVVAGAAGAAAGVAAGAGVAKVVAEKKSAPVEEVEELDEVEELSEDVDELDEVEELAEEVDELDEVEELADAEDDDIEVLEEYVEPKTSYDAEDAFFKSLAVPKIEYKPSNDTYFPSENFAHVENLFAEPLCLGDDGAKIQTVPMNLVIYPLPEYEHQNPVVEEEPLAEESVDAPVSDYDENDSEDEELLADVEDFIDVDIIEEENHFHVQPEHQEKTEETLEEIGEEAEVADEIPLLSDEPDFTMTTFADNLDTEVPELESALSIPQAPENTIVENDGVYSISENIEYTNVIQDPDFKELVDSIL